MNKKPAKSKCQTDVNPDETITQRWEAMCSKHLVGQTIKYVRYLYSAEMKDLCWTKKSLVIFFTDGTYIFSTTDDEQNNAGSYVTNIKGLEGIPSI
jgi:hypothetical protein